MDKQIQKMEAVERIMQAWGVDEQAKVDAFRLILQDVEPWKVIQAISEIQNGLGALESLKPR